MNLEEKEIISFQAVSYDKHFLKLFNKNKSGETIGKIHSIYSRTINILDSENFMYTIGSKNIDNSPLTLRIDNKDISFEDLNLKEDSLLFKTEDKIIIDNRIEIILESKELLWDSNIKTVQYLDIKTVKNNIECFNSLILKKGSYGGCKYFYLKNYLKNEEHKPNLIEKELYKRIKKLLDNLDSESLEDNINSLIGFGIGLTPSGDDFLTGFLSTFNIISTDYTNKIKKKITNLITIDKVSTTDVSRQMLLVALKGEMREYILSFIHSFLSEDKERILLDFENVLQIGSSSGTDLSIGVITAFSLLISNLNMEGKNMQNTIVRKNSYYDSVTLMSLSSKILDLKGVEEAVVSMATEMNKELLQNVGLSTEESDNAGNNDLIIAVKAENENAYEEATKLVDELLNSKTTKKKKGEEISPKTINGALEQMEDANLAVISVPGKFAGREARQALENGLHVMLFSDNVSLEDERELKELGREKGLLVMGPDCGTASINNVGLCFANKVRKGNIGIVGASGTGLQEVMVQIHRLGGGVSQGIGTGGRDLKEEIGGIMMIEGLKALNRDENTEVIVLVSKPPAKSVEHKILEEIKKVEKPIVICFLDGDEEEKDSKAYFVQGIYEAAEKAVELSGVKTLETKDETHLETIISEEKKDLNSEQKYFRGLFCGGTLCAEALSVLRKSFDNIKSNVAKIEKEKLEDINNYSGNVLLDLGEDEFTNGKPHPMIEPTLRLDRILKEGKDKEVGVILMDFELGYGSHDDPVGVTVKTIKQVKDTSKDEGRNLIFVGYICGTDIDKQNYKEQRKILEEAGVIIAESNIEAADIVAKILS
jgi:succinyl-CoA synthetase alpha subunit